MPKIFQIGLLLYPNCMPAGLLAFTDLLQAANRRTGNVLFEMHLIGMQSGPVECAHGLVLTPTYELSTLALDSLLIPGFWAQSLHDVDTTLANNATLIATLAKLSKRCEMWSYCTGVCLLAAAKRLKGQAATVTWWLADAMLERFPNIDWQTEKNCIVNERNATATGVNGYLPIAQTVIEQRVSTTVFHDLTRLMVLPRPAETHPTFHTLNLIEQRSQLLRRLYVLVQALPAEHITVQVLSNALSICARTLARKVKAESGMALAAYARGVKLSQVAERLALTSTPVKRISDELGFSSDSNMRRMFRELTQLTPAQYRQRFAR